MNTDPRFAPRRNDLPWLRRRRVPKAVRAEVEHAHEAVTEFVAGHAPHEHHHDRAHAASPSPSSSSTPTPSSSSLDLDAPAAPRKRSKPAPEPAPLRPAASGSLDLDVPDTPSSPPAAPSGPSSSSSLDLDEPAPASSRPVAASASLDLDERTPTPARRPAPAQPAGSRKRRRSDVRVKPGQRRILTVTEPTVTLTRLQSGIGTLSFEAACSDAVGDLRIGAAYELHGESAQTGLTSTAQLTQGHRLAPPDSRRPILVCSHDRFETIEVDLRQCTELRRVLVYAFSEGRRPLNWGGTLITTTSGGARVELPMESLQSGDSAALLSLYNVRGEFVLRAEMLTVFGDVREVCRNYGFDRITWLDDRTPVD